MRRVIPSLLVLLSLVGAAHAEDPAPRWIVVTAPAFHEVVEPLCAHRRDQGYRVLRLPLPDAGVAPEVLRRLLRTMVGEDPSRASVLLVGAVLPPEDVEDPASYVVPAWHGSLGRMTGEPTDNPYACLDDDRIPDLALGRLPARSVEEARQMVAKTLAFETDPGPRPWRHRITLLVGHPGGSSALERRFASTFVGQQIATPFAGLDPRWRTRAIVHMEESPYYVPDAGLHAASRAAVEEGQLFTVYLGHSSPANLGSAGVDMLTRDDWRTMDLSAGPGILLSCGCYTCQVTGWFGEGFGVAAMRNPRGPVAVVGAEGESYGAMGKLAFEGLLPLLRRADPPTRLGDWWLAMMRGIGQGSIGQLTFWLYDNADGTGGRVPLDDQRREHLEMWMLLGDPALVLPLDASGMTLEVEGEAGPGATLAARGRLPSELADGDVRVTLERPFGTPPVAPRGEDAVPAEAMNAVVLLDGSAKARGPAYDLRLVLPERLPGERWILRARATKGPVDREVATWLEGVASAR